MKVAVITPSFNKKEYVMEAVGSVLTQSLPDFSYLIVENSTDKTTRELFRPGTIIDDGRVTVQTLDFSEEFRKEFYAPAYILNTFLNKLDGEYIFYLSDDDILLPNCFVECVSFLDAHPDKDVVYFAMQGKKEVLNNSSGFSWKNNGVIEAKYMIPKKNGVDCMLDGGQVMFRKSLLQQLTQPYFETSWATASHCDGIFLSRLNQLVPFYPIDQTLLIHRTTHVSTHINS